jgi:hypothetical protein
MLLLSWWTWGHVTFHLGISRRLENGALLKTMVCIATARSNFKPFEAVCEFSICLQ